MTPVGFIGKRCWVSCRCTQAPRSILKQICNIFPFHLTLMLDEYRGTSSCSNSRWMRTHTDVLQESYIYNWEVGNDCPVTAYGSAAVPFSRAVAHPFMEMCSSTSCHFGWRGKDGLAVHQAGQPHSGFQFMFGSDRLSSSSKDASENKRFSMCHFSPALSPDWQRFLWPGMEYFR